MATYYFNFEMDRNHNSDLSYRLKVEETVNIGSNSSGLNVTLEYKNTSGKLISDHSAEYYIAINGNVITGNKTVTHNILTKNGEWQDSGSNWLKGSLTVAHLSDGTGSFTVSASIKGDVLLGYYRTVGNIDVTQSLTAINQSAPTLSDISVSADRYGLDAAAKFTAAHSAYKLTKIVFKLKNLTETQAKNRVGKSTQASTSSYVYDSSRSAYTLVLEKNSNLSTSNSITFDLDCIDETSYPLTSGKTYDYEVVLTALNGKTLTKTGSFTVPQKVTGVTCDAVINIMQGSTAQLNYAVLPTNAQLQTVKFTSSDTAVATVDTSGLITAKEISGAFATAIITVKTDDGSYTAKCTVNVTTTEPFPALSPVTQYLSAELFSQIISATAIVYSELTDAGAALSSLSGVTISGKNEPVVNIMPAFKNVEADCQKLRTAAASLGLSTDPLPSTAQTINKQNTDWLIVVNNWINFLNSLHSQLGGV